MPWSCDLGRKQGELSTTNCYLKGRLITQGHRTVQTQILINVAILGDLIREVCRI